MGGGIFIIVTSGFDWGLYSQCQGGSLVHRKVNMHANNRTTSTIYIEKGGCCNTLLYV